MHSIRKRRRERGALSARQLPAATLVQFSRIVPNSSLESFAPGCVTKYVGPPELILNGISSMYTPSGQRLELLSGTNVRVCTRRVVRLHPNHPSSSLVHFTTRRSGHEVDCNCGSCGYTFLLSDEAPDACACGTGVFDEGDHCSIM